MRKRIPLDLQNSLIPKSRYPASSSESLIDIAVSAKATAIGAVQGLTSNFQIYKLPRETVHGGNQIFTQTDGINFDVTAPLRIITKQDHKRYFSVRNMSAKVLTYYLYITSAINPFNSTTGAVTTNPVSLMGVKDAEVHLFNYNTGVGASAITLREKFFSPPRINTGLSNYYDPTNEIGATSVLTLGTFTSTVTGIGFSAPILQRWIDSSATITLHFKPTSQAVGFELTAAGGGATQKFLILSITLSEDSNGYMKQNDIYFANDSSVSAVNGITLHTDEEFIFTINSNEELWGIGAALNDMTHNVIGSLTLPRAFDLFSPGGIGANLPFLGNGVYAYGGNSNNTVQVIELK